MYTRRNILSLFLLLTIAALSGCVATTATISSVTEIKPGQGIVTLRMTSNISGPLVSGSRWVGIDVKRIDKKKKTEDEADEIYTISRATTGSMRSAIFLGALPAGQYKFVKLSSGRFYVDIKDELPSFHVKPVKTTYLGTLIDHPEYNMAFSGSLYFAVDPREDNMLQILRSEFPKIGSAFTTPLLGWDSQFKAKGPFVTLDLVKNNTAMLNKPVGNDRGEIFVGSMLGQILKRDTNGRWTQLDTGSIHEVISVSPIDSKTLIAGGDAGLFVVSNDQGKSWKNLPPIPVRGAIFFTGRDSTGKFYAVTRRANNAILFTCDDIYKGNWQKLREFKLERGWNVPWSAAEVNLIDDQLFMAMPPHNFHGYNIATKKWHDSLAPFSWTGQVKMLQGGMTYAVGTAGILNSLFVSPDYGKTWSELDTSTRSANPIFVDPSNGYMTHSKAISIIAAQYEQVLHRTEDGGKTWQEMGLLPSKFYNGLFATGKNSPLFMTTSDGTIYATTDYGKTWKAERTNVLVYNAKKNK